MTRATTRRPVSSGAIDHIVDAATMPTRAIRNGCPASPFSAVIGRVAISPSPRAYMGKNIARSIAEPAALTPWSGRKIAQG